MKLSTLTDEQLISRLRTKERYRYRVGIPALIFGVILSTSFVLLAKPLVLGADQLLSFTVSQTTPSTQDQAFLMAQTQFITGFAVGFSLASALIYAAGSLIVGVWLLVPSPRDRLLLRLWDTRPQATTPAPPDQPSRTQS